MKIATLSKRLVRKKVLIPASIGVGILLVSAALIAATPVENSIAQQQLETNETMSTNISQFDAVHKINGSVNVRYGIESLFAENARAPFVTEAQTAQDQIVNGTVLGGRLGVTQG
jgi:hypothetical protein